MIFWWKGFNIYGEENQVEIDHFGIQIKQTFRDLENCISADTDQHTMQIGWALLGNLFLNTTQFR